MDYVTLAKQAVRGLEDTSVDRSPSSPRPDAPDSATATKATYATKGVQTDYETLARSPLVARVRAAWPWLAEHRPDLYQGVQDADEAGDLERLIGAMEAASRAYEQRPCSGGTRIYSRLLGAELWVAADEAAAAELRREGVTLPVLLPDEAQTLGRMAEATAREMFAALARVQRVMPGSRLRSVEVFDA